MLCKLKVESTAKADYPSIIYVSMNTYQSKRVESGYLNRRPLVDGKAHTIQKTSRRENYRPKRIDH